MADRPTTRDWILSIVGAGLGILAFAIFPGNRMIEVGFYVWLAAILLVSIERGRGRRNL